VRKEGKPKEKEKENRSQHNEVSSFIIEGINLCAQAEER
jgi:hypothetical protein